MYIIGRKLHQIEFKKQKTAWHTCNEFNKTMTSHHFYHNGAEMLAAKFDQSDSLDRVETVQRGAILKITVSFKLPWRETNDRHTETKVAGQQFPSHLIFAESFRFL